MANESMKDTWATGADGWVRNERTFDAAFRPFTDALVVAARLEAGARVLDVGCGAGTLLHEAVAAGADAVGVDISPPMIDAARRRAPGATALVADAQTADLLELAPGPPFERVVSRFGVMFFADPREAFANLRSASAPGARLAFVCWRDLGTEVFLLGLDPLLARIDDPPERPRVGVAGPLGLAEADTIKRVLAASGWTDVAIEAVDGVCDFGVDGSDGVEERLQVALAGMVGRAARAELEARLGPEGWEQALEEARTELRTHVVDGSVRFVAHTWLVTARNG